MTRSWRPVLLMLVGVVIIIGGAYASGTGRIVILAGGLVWVLNAVRIALKKRPSPE